MPQQPVDQVQVVYYTDPLCCWSWAFEPQWRRLRYEFAGQLRCQYRMGGLIASWQTFQDPLNVVSRPFQMGPLWMEARYTSGMPLHDRVWINNPPDSSYPACIAVKCARLQSEEAEEHYLRAVREAIMLEGRNVAEYDVLLAVAARLAQASPELLNLQQFEEDMQNEGGQDAFREDLQQVRYHRIGRFPTITLQKPSQPGIIFTGYRPYAVLREALARVAPELQPTQVVPDAETYSRYWRSITPREIAEVVSA